MKRADLQNESNATVCTAAKSCSRASKWYAAHSKTQLFRGVTVDLPRDGGQGGFRAKSLHLKGLISIGTPSTAEARCEAAEAGDILSYMTGDSCSTIEAIEPSFYFFMSLCFYVLRAFLPGSCAPGRVPSRGSRNQITAGGSWVAVTRPLHDRYSFLIP